MDPRITKALKKAEDQKRVAEKFAVEQRKNEEKKHKKMIQSFMPAARKWIKKNLFDLIAKAEVDLEMFNRTAYYKNRQEIPKVFLYTHDNSIPGEALAKAAGEIDGIHIESEWREFFSDGEGYSEPGHWNYYATWSKEDFKGKRGN